MMGFVEKIQRAHWMYREGKPSEALACFTEALAMAKTKEQRITLYSNRAACYLKLHDFKKASNHCDRLYQDVNVKQCRRVLIHVHQNQYSNFRPRDDGLSSSGEQEAFNEDYSSEA